MELEAFRKEALAQGYDEVRDRSIYVTFPLDDGRELVVWTTTPWTLPSNVAAAVHPDLTYARVRQGDEVLYLSRGTLSRLVGDYEDLGSVKGTGAGVDSTGALVLADGPRRARFLSGEISLRRA